MTKGMIPLMFLVLFLSVSFVLAGDPQTPQQQTSQALNNELAECEANLSILQQQLQELNQTLENVTRERDYYKTLYENVAVNVTNLELIQIKQNITILTQQIQQLNLTLSSIEQRTEMLLVKARYFKIGIGTLIGITLFDHLVQFVHWWRRKKEKDARPDKNKKEVPNKNEHEKAEDSAKIS